MGKKVLKVLSIDWDFFIKATNDERLMLFPDSGREDLPKAIKSLIWESLYGANRKALEKIGVVNLFKRIRFDLAHSIRDYHPKKVVICESHRHIYQYIKGLMKAGEFSGIDLLNIDFHHDCFTDKDEVDCGNWLYHIMKEYEGEYRWLSRKDSFLSKEHPVGKLKRLKQYRSIQDEKFNLVYICRSDMWSPPHLDKSFYDLVSFIPFWDLDDSEVLLEDGILEARETRGEYSKFIEDCRNGKIKVEGK